MYNRHPYVLISPFFYPFTPVAISLVPFAVFLVYRLKTTHSIQNNILDYEEETKEVQEDVDNTYLDTTAIEEENIEDHKMHEEYYEISAEAAERINKAKAAGGRVIAVGTTSTRTLETVADENGILKAESGWTNSYIYPGYHYKIVDGLITNFHLPKSSLLMLVSALAGKDKIFRAYEHAVAEKYRFFSFGDAMLIL